MTDQNALYAAIKPDIQLLSAPLFDFSKQCLVKQGNFLPHAAVLSSEGEVRLVGAMGEKDRTTSVEILPLLHAGLRNQAKEMSFSAIAVAESVTITPEGKNSTKAIKVLFEHHRGMTVALYLPYEKKLFKGYVYGAMLSMLAKPEINAW